MKIHCFEVSAEQVDELLKKLSGHPALWEHGWADGHRCIWCYDMNTAEKVWKLTGIKNLTREDLRNGSR